MKLFVFILGFVAAATTTTAIIAQMSARTPCTRVEHVYNVSDCC